MNTDLSKKAKNDFKKDFFKVDELCVLNNKFQKTIENVRKQKLVATEIRRNYLVPGPNYHTAKFFTEHLLAIEMKKSNKNTDE